MNPMMAQVITVMPNAIRPVVPEKSPRRPRRIADSTEELSTKPAASLDGQP